MSETIAAIATGLTESGIGIVRISGDDSYSIISKILFSISLHNLFIKTDLYNLSQIISDFYKSN